jgi:hypothetical protein
MIRDEVLVEAPPEQALAVIKDLNCLAQYEPKVDSLRVTQKMRTGGTYTARGRFAGLPWQGRFSYEMRPHGFHSEMIAGPPGVRVSGGFVVCSDMPDLSHVIHYEHYQLSWWLWPFVLPLRLYLKQAIKNELHVVAQLIQRAAKQTL